MLKKLLTSIFLTISLPALAEKPPNIIIILADDMAYGALSYTGNKEVTTPNIDMLCEQGLFCPDGYATHGVCAPSRAGLMTGRYQARFGYETLSGPTEHAKAVKHGVDTNELFISELLQKNGYATATYGKWHLGVNEEFQPLQRGFDHQYGFAGGGGPYWNRANHGLLFDGKPVDWPEGETEKGAYQPDFLTDDAISWMKEVSPAKPFFIYFAPYSVHGPFHAPEELIPEGKHPMVGMMKAFDNNIGRIVQAVKDMGEYENTIFIFLSDNGGIPKLFEHGFTNEPYSGGKAAVVEGGIRVPFTWLWPGKIEGDQFPGIVSSLDIMPTLAAVAGADLPTDREYDGINLLPALTGKSEPISERTLCWRWRNGHAVRQGKWKLTWELDWGEFHKLRREQGLDEPSPTARPNPNDRFSSLYTKPRLYDLSKDPGETTDLSAQFPEIAEQLKKELVKFDNLAKPISQEDIDAWPKP